MYINILIKKNLFKTLQDLQSKILILNCFVHQ